MILMIYLIWNNQHRKDKEKMYIKQINNVVGYKGLLDGFCAEFDENTTYIVGENFQGKSTIGSLFSWCLTGNSLLGKEKEQVANDSKKVSNVIVDMIFVDNYGIEHRLVRNKGKEIQLTLDDKPIEQGMLAQFYKDADIFLVAHNPYYFSSLEPKEQKELLRKIVPAIDSKTAYDLLNQEEQEIIGQPIEYLGSYIDNKNTEINELQKEYNQNLGQLQAYQSLALQQEGEFLTFDKEKELAELQEKDKVLSANFVSFSIDEMKSKIAKIQEKLDDILKKELVEIKELYNRENKKLEGLNAEKPKCQYCKQEIKDSEALQRMKKFQQKELARLQEKADELKEEATMLAREKESKQRLLEKLNTKDMQQLEKEKQEIKTRIDLLQEEQKDIVLKNQEVQIKREQVKEAKNSIELLKQAQEEITKELEKVSKQKKIANKLKILIIEKQSEIIKQYLDKVSIQFSKVNKSTGEIIECCNIQYEGRDYKKLSKSQQARASLEISNVFNNLSGIKAPIFFDDAESCTDFIELANTQMVVSLVIKYNSLEILYDYSDVLSRKKKSVEREIKEKSSLFIEQAA
ncbi:MAG: AAA family ATPase [Clostridia bacterium]|nr:AAA family ATPase [Clostridia bacterium]